MRSPLGREKESDKRQVASRQSPITSRQSPVASRQKQPQSAFRIINEFRVVIELQNFDCMVTL